MNEDRTRGPGRSNLTQAGSRFELVSYRGEIFGPYASAQEAAAAAKEKWPDQEQDPERTGKGWDVQIAGVK